MKIVLQASIDSSRYVKSRKYECVYNRSGRYKHIAVLIYYLNHKEIFMKTSEDQQGGRPNARQLAKGFCAQKYLEEMFVLFPTWLWNFIEIVITVFGAVFEVNYAVGFVT